MNDNSLLDISPLAWIVTAPLTTELIAFAFVMMFSISCSDGFGLFCSSFLTYSPTTCPVAVAIAPALKSPPFSLAIAPPTSECITVFAGKLFFRLPI